MKSSWIDAEPEQCTPGLKLFSTTSPPCALRAQRSTSLCVALAHCSRGYVGMYSLSLTTMPGAPSCTLRTVLLYHGSETTCAAELSGTLESVCCIAQSPVVHTTALLTTACDAPAVHTSARSTHQLSAYTAVHLCKEKYDIFANPFLSPPLSQTTPRKQRTRKQTKGDFRVGNGAPKTRPRARSPSKSNNPSLLVVACVGPTTFTGRAWRVPSASTTRSCWSSRPTGSASSTRRASSTSLPPSAPPARATTGACRGETLPSTSTSC